MEPSLDEQRLLVRCAGGDREAWAALRAQYHKPLRGMLRDAGATDELEDLEQEVWHRLIADDCAALREFRGGSFRVFLRRVAMNVCLDHARNRGARPPAASTLTPTSVAISSETPGAEKRYARFQQREQLARALDEAAAESDNPARDRDILRLRFDEEWSAAEIASLGLGLGVDGVEAVIRRAVERLKALLESER
jgi:RNA polymerase sigma factor (sigma-70 family)